MKTLEGNVALVTGASRGIGEAIAVALGAAGARVICAARSKTAIDAIATRIGNGAESRVLDVTDSKQVDATIDEVAKACGRLDIVVNNAGASERGRVSSGTDEWFERMLRVNLTGTFFVSRAALRHLREGGRIINIASVLGVFGVGDSAGYCAAKHGVIGLTRALASEVAARGIAVNAVCPGWVDTEMAADGFELIAQVTRQPIEAAKKKALDAVPLGRILSPAEIASTVVFLCDPEARGIHGQAIRIDGGATPW